MYSTFKKLHCFKRFIICFSDFSIKQFNEMLFSRAAFLKMETKQAICLLLMILVNFLMILADKY